MNLINIENLTKVYTERKLFDGASFSLQDGEKVGIIGVNGTGKTTLLRMLRQITHDHMVSRRDGSLVCLLFPHDHP